MSVSTSSVVSFAYKNGIIMAADTAGSYGSLALPNITKLYKLTAGCIVGFSGAVADIQHLHKLVSMEIADDTRPLDPQGIHKMIQRILYHQRSKLKLLNVSVIVCGLNKGKPCPGSLQETTKLIGVVNSKGNFWFDTSAATGIASHLILPIIRERNIAEMSREEAVALMEECMRVLCYKDCRASNVIQMAFCEEAEAMIAPPYSLETNWEIGAMEGELVL